MGWGIEAVHTWNGALALNDLSSFPHYKVRRISGLHALGDPEDNRDVAVGRLGEVARRSFRRGKTVTYEGDVRARSLADLRDAEEALRGAFFDLAEGEMVISSGTVVAERTFTGRALDLNDDDEQVASPARATFGFERPFAVGVRLWDPRLYDAAEQTSDGSACPNGGTVATDPVLTVEGPTTGPTVLTNTTISRALTFHDDFTLSGGQLLTVDFQRRRIDVDGIPWAFALARVGSDWWNPAAPGLVPGANVVTLDGGGTLTVIWHDAYA